MEVFPPTFESRGNSSIGLGKAEEDFIAGIKKVALFADRILVADLKDTSLLTLSPVRTAQMVHERTGLEAIPVIVARDFNRHAFRAAVVTAFETGCKSVLLAWGDRLPPGAGAKNVYDYGSLSEAIAEAKQIMVRARVDGKILGPVDLRRLATPEGRKLAASRLKAGADLLVAQPPSYTRGVLREHVKTLRRSGLEDRVLPAVFPFRGADDLLATARKFQWDPPAELLQIANKGRNALNDEARSVVSSARRYRLPGVCISTRGTPELAGMLLDS